MSEYSLLVSREDGECEILIERWCTPRGQKIITSDRYIMVDRDIRISTTDDISSYKKFEILCPMTDDPKYSKMSVEQYYNLHHNKCSVSIFDLALDYTKLKTGIDPRTHPHFANYYEMTPEGIKWWYIVDTMYL